MMSVFDTFFKLNTTAKTEMQQKTNAMNVIIDSVHNKLTIAEAERIYDIIAANAMTLSTDTARINEGMKILTEMKANWLTTEEKENFVAGVWLCECARDSKNNSGITYINPEELQYTRQAVLGMAFKQTNNTSMNF